ncbi:TIGR01212 family radical SAM protein [Neptunitalea chrysea]|uniref:TIGR01212 family radical SAM protein n=1 Tax=Neptunitalea chrysea TaxID=1647581 RepID=A0A9W6B3V3_9FLAO|nr:TIGR01212 family radical SAM protein [Neptunitalea chrysea]GLB52016.1 TIGR01212 family radical SAM protein [Neptunitalea chrysea]
MELLDGITLPYLNYNTVLKDQFGGRVQKISINAGFTCPNRDGSKGYGGCTYCNNQSFSPNFSKEIQPITEQIDNNISFFNKRYKSQYYLAYFQSYTNTYDTLANLKQLYGEALKHPQIEGIVIGTRPDCVSDTLLDYFAEMAKEKYVMIEYGIESTNNKTLDFIHRGHTYECAVDAIEATAKRGIHTGAHLILGLPGENKNIILEHAEKISKLPLDTLKLHQLQLVKGTIMAKQYKTNPEWFQLYTKEEYLELVISFLERLRPDIAMERFISQSPLRLLIAPTWGLKNYEFANMLQNTLQQKQTWQGKYYET